MSLSYLVGLGILVALLGLALPLAGAGADVVVGVSPAPPAPVLGIDGLPVVRESTEWAQIWNPGDDDLKTPRVLLIGDSISVGYGEGVRTLLQGQYLVDGLGTSRSVNDPILADEMLMMLKEHQYVAIHFNNGLHGQHLDGPAYLSGLRAFTKLLVANAAGAKLVWATSTPVTEAGQTHPLAKQNDMVIARNALAAQLMAELGIPTDDLYAAVVGQGELWSPDGVHLLAPGYQILSKSVADSVLKALKP
jgi:hypothetical protein